MSENRKVPENKLPIQPQSIIEFKGGIAMIFDFNKVFHVKRSPMDSLMVLPDQYVYKDTDDEEDRRLASWRKWMKVRENQHKRFMQDLDRSPDELVMNSSEGLREILEIKEIFTFKDVYPPDIRGADEFWGMPLHLKSNCPCVPDLDLVRTKYERGIVPEIEYVRQPLDIKKEKGIVKNIYKPERKKCPDSHFMSSNYRKERENFFEKKMKMIEPHRPELDEVIVVGRGHHPKRITKDAKIIPIIIINCVEELFGRTIATLEEVETAVALRVNNTIFLKDTRGCTASCIKDMMREPWHEYTTRWEYHFKAPLNKMVTQYVDLYNIGNVAIECSWRSIPTIIPSERVTPVLMPQKQTLPVFFFRKTATVLSPGQHIRIPVWYKPGMLCRRQEAWELRTNIRVLNDDTEEDKLVFEMYGDTVDPENAKKVINVIDYIKKKTAEIIAIRSANDIIYYSKPEVPAHVPYENFFVEKDVFEFKNPKLYYHQTLVNQMKLMYHNITSCNWDLAVESVRNAMSRLPTTTKTEFYEQFKLLLRGMQMPIEDDNIMTRNKYFLCYKSMCHYIDKFYQESRNIRGVINPNLPSTSVTITAAKKTPYRFERKVVPQVVEALDEEQSRELELEPRSDVYYDTFFVTMYYHLGDLIDNLGTILDSINAFEPMKSNIRTCPRFNIP